MPRTAQTKRPVAEVTFATKLKTILTPTVLVHIFPSAPSPDTEDFDAERDCVMVSLYGDLDTAGLEKLFFQYGTYLELIGGDVTVEVPFSWGFTPAARKVA